MNLTLKYTAQSNSGLVRKNNEDAVYAGSRLLALADGVGGNVGGEVASQLIISAIAALDNDDPGEDILQKLTAAVQSGNEAIQSTIEQNPKLQGMGTTLTAMLFSQGKIALAHIGDSRAYIYRENTLNQLTKDDTLVQEMVDQGKLDPNEVATHPKRSIITKALTGQNIEPSLAIREVSLGDRFILCSDGLTDVVDDNTIAITLQDSSIESIADKLIKLALGAGGPDNVTVIVAEIVADNTPQVDPIVTGAGEEIKNPKLIKNNYKIFSKKFLLTFTVIIMLLTLSLGIGIKKLMNSSYFVGTSAAQITIFKGTKGTFLGKRLYKPYYLVCISNLSNQTLAKKQIYYYQSNTSLNNNCNPLKLTDLNNAALISIRDLKTVNKLDTAKKQVEKLTTYLLPLCTKKLKPVKKTKCRMPHS